jgi:hypothetical protein
MPTKERYARMTEEQKKVDADRLRKWQGMNKDKTRAYQQKARDLYPERERKTCYKSALKRYYGLTYEQYEEMLKAQDFKCAICGTEESGSKRTDKLFVDHDHDTNEVRKLLCMKCNMALGVFKNIKLLQKAIDYLNSNKNKETINAIQCQ